MQPLCLEDAGASGGDDARRIPVVQIERLSVQLQSHQGPFVFRVGGGHVHGAVRTLRFEACDPERGGRRRADSGHQVPDPHAPPGRRLAPALDTGDGKFVLILRQCLELRERQRTAGVPVAHGERPVLCPGQVGDLGVGGGAVNRKACGPVPIFRGAKRLNGSSQEKDCPAVVSTTAPVVTPTAARKARLDQRPGSGRAAPSSVTGAGKPARAAAWGRVPERERQCSMINGSFTAIWSSSDPQITQANQKCV